MDGYYRIAELTVAMDTFGRTLSQAAAYRMEMPGEADLVIQSDWKALQNRQPHLSAEDCEYLTTGGSFYRQLPAFDGMMLHASAVMLEGKAYLFCAPCGTGKSTHTSLWLRRFSGRARILNDDKPALRLVDGCWYAYGTPWSGKHDISINERAPLAGIAMLRRSAENKINPLTGAKAVAAFLEQTARPADPLLRSKLLELAVDLVEKVPVWQLLCNMEQEAAEVAYEAMRKE